MRKALLALVLSSSALSAFACGGGESPPPKDETVKPAGSTPTTAADAGAPAVDRTAELQKLGADAYVWGYPLVFLERTRRTMTNLQHLPLDTFSHRSKLSTPADADVLPNNDVLLSSAWVELKDEPVTLSLPDMGARWFSIAFIDMYGNPFAHVSRKTGAGKAATYTISGPSDATPAGANVIKAPTNAVWVLARTQVDGEADVAKLLGTLKQMTLKTKSGQAPPMPPAPEARPQDVKFAGAAFFDELGEALKLYPPPAAQADWAAKLAKAGIGPGMTPSKTLGEKEALALSDGQKQGEAAIEDKLEKLAVRKKGWDLDQKFGKWGDDWLARAAYARRGFEQQVAEEVFSPLTGIDDGEQLLTGAHEYVLHFDKGQAPPAAMWSVWLYGAKSAGLVDNPKKRYSVSPKTLRAKADGSLDIFIQADPPKGSEGNWLPAPKQDAFVVMLRAYQPKAEMTSYEVPAVKKIK